VGRPPYRLRGLSRTEVERVVCTEEPTAPSAAATENAAAAESAAATEADGQGVEGGTSRPDAGRPDVLKQEVRRRSRRLRGDLDNIVLMALRKEPERRYASVAALAEDVHRYRRREPVSARPNRLAYRLRRLARRRSGLVALAVAGVLLAGLLTAMLAGPQAEHLEDLVAERIVVLPFENQTGEGDLDAVGRMAADWITQGISRAGLGQVVPLMDLLNSTSENQNASQFDVAEAARAARAGKVVVGVYYRVGDQLQFQARVVDARKSLLIEAVEPVMADAADPRDGIAQLRQRVTGVLATVFDPGHLRGGVSAEFRGRPPTLEGYRTYAEGLDRFLERDFERAAALMIRATELDPSFHEPKLLASIALMNLRQYERADSLTTPLLAVQEQLSPSDHLFLQVVRAILDRDAEREMALMDRLILLYPSGMHVLQASWQGVVYNHPHRTIKYMSTVDPAHGSLRRWGPYFWGVLPTAHHLLGQHEAELDAARSGADLYPEARERLLWLELPSLAATGRCAELREAVERVGSTRFTTPAGVRGLAAAELRAHGYPDTAAVYLAEALQWYATRSPEQQDGLRADFALTLYHAGRFGEARTLYEALLAEAPEPMDARSRRTLIDLRGRLGAIAARQGDLAEARRVEGWLGSLDWPHMRGIPTVWRARIAAALGEHDRAADLLDRALHVDGALSGTWVHTDPDFVEMRHHRGFQEILRPRGGG
jgi:TolB-like protein